MHLSIAQYLQKAIHSSSSTSESNDLNLNDLLMTASEKALIFFPNTVEWMIGDEYV